MAKWSLKRTVQCAKCPWKAQTDPHQIPNGYSETKHAALSRTIADPGSLRDTGHAMACHETHDAHCIGWLINQVGAGNNIGLRLRMMSCDNAGQIRTVGEQHERFEDTLPLAQARGLTGAEQNTGLVSDSEAPQEKP